ASERAACSSSEAGRAGTSARCSRSPRRCARSIRRWDSSSSVVVADAKLNSCRPPACRSTRLRCHRCETRIRVSRCCGPSRSRRRTVLAGTPIRASLLKWTRERGRETFAVPAEAMLVVVSGGSQGSERVNDALWSALGRIIRRAYVLHITSDKHGTRAEARRANLPDETRDHYIVRRFLGDEMGGALAAADLAIGRA